MTDEEEQENVKGPFGFFSINRGAKREEEPTQQVTQASEVTAEELDSIKSDIKMLGGSLAAARSDIHMTDVKSETVMDQSNNIAVTVDDLLANVPKIINQENQGWMQNNFDSFANSWYEAKDIKPKSEDWFKDQSIRDKMTTELNIPEGMVPEDVGELLLLFNNVGKDIPLEVAPAGGTWGPTQPGGGAGISPGGGGSGLPSGGGGYGGIGGPYTNTIAGINDIDNRLRTLMIHGFGPINDLGYNWMGDNGYWTNLQFLKNNRSSIYETITDMPSIRQDLGDFRNGILPGPVVSTISGMINAKFQSFQAMVGASVLDSDQKSILANLASVVQGTDRKVYEFTDELSNLYVKDFLNEGVADMDSRINLWADKGFLAGKIADLVNLEFIGSRMSPEYIEGMLSGGWFRGKFGENIDGLMEYFKEAHIHGLMSKVSIRNRRLYMKDAFPSLDDLEKYGTDFQDIGPNRGDITGIKGKLGGLHDAMETCRVNIGKHLESLQQRRDAMKKIRGEIGDFNPLNENHITGMNSITREQENATGDIKNIVTEIKDMLQSMVNTLSPQ